MNGPAGAEPADHRRTIDGPPAVVAPSERVGPHGSCSLVVESPSCCCVVTKRTCVLGWLPSSSASCPWVQLGQCMEYSFLPWLAFLCIEETHGGDPWNPVGRAEAAAAWSDVHRTSGELVLLKSRSDVDHTPNGVPPPFAPEVGVLFSARSEHRPRTSNVTDTGEQSSSGLDPRPTIPPGGPPLRSCHRLKKESHDRAIASPESTNHVRDLRGSGPTFHRTTKCSLAYAASASSRALLGVQRVIRSIAWVPSASNSGTNSRNRSDHPARSATRFSSSGNCEVPLPARSTE